MSALRQLLAALWAALWVRWRLVAVRARGLFGERRAAAAAGSGFYLGATEIPVEGIDAGRLLMVETELRFSV